MPSPFDPTAGITPTGSRTGAPGRVRRILRRLLLGTGILAGLLVLAALAGGIWLRSQLRASLPTLDGDLPLQGLAAPVRVETDALGVPRIIAASRADAARATGFLHAQNRFFQMDLMRRQAAGELAALFGPALLREDQRNRLHRFRALARRVIEQAGPEERPLLLAYRDGANAGLAALGAKPFEYLALRMEPEPWRLEDSVLVILTMFITLHDDDGSQESALGVARDVLPAPLFEFLAPRGTEWDAPIAGAAFTQPPVPGSEVFDLRSAPAAASLSGPSPGHDPWKEPARPGSNNWAVAGRLAADGGAILANDMHLGLSVPNIWYRLSLEWKDAEGGESRRVTGVSLPGTPAIVAGSNTRVAWGFTNSQGDWHDLVILEPVEGDPNGYLTPEGPKRFEHHSEIIHVNGGPDESLDVADTIWGPILDKDHRGRLRALRWTAHDERAVNFGLFRMEAARDLDEALDAAARAGVPPQNCVIADSTGRIGWTIMGAIPRRAGFDGSVPVSWADGAHRWDGWLDPAEYPRVVDPESGRIWTANARVVDGPMLAVLGDGGYDLGARARQIRDDLLALEKATPRDMLNVQLDDRALFLQRWRDLFLRAVTPEAAAADPRRAELRRLVEDWGGRAAVDSAGYRMVRSFRFFLAERVFNALTASCRKADSRFSFGEFQQMEGPLWALVTERPAHLLDPNYRSWDDQIAAAVDFELEYFLKEGGALADQTWGRRNMVRMQHPISLAVPPLSGWLDMPAEPLPGDTGMPRVQAPGFGASERMAVSPGREDKGLFHMPGGQSGHPLSPHYRDGHAAWARGEPAPFLPGPAAHTLTFSPPT